MQKRKAGKSRHHRLARAQGGTFNYPTNNISLVSTVEHRAFNLLFGGSATVWEVVRKLSKIWIDPRYEIVVRRKHERNNGEQVLCSEL
jgi:hypothetical protein